jgi:hypothetical protein
MTLGRALRWVVEEHLGDPSRSALASEAYIQGRLAEAIPGGVDIPVKPVVVFTHPAVRLEVEGEGTAPVCKVDRLKKVVVDKGKKLPGEVYEQVCAVLENGG